MRLFRLQHVFFCTAYAAAVAQDSRKAQALRAQGRLDDMKQLYKDCIKRFRKNNMFWKDALQNEFPEASS